MVWRYGQMQPTSWDDALDLVARVTVAVINEQGEDGLFVSAFDHGGAGGGYENTWGTGKLYFGAMKIKNIRIHNRPAYNSEVHATRDMGVGELNNCYEDAELADTIFAVGTNALETQTNYFLNHWIPNLRGTSLDKKKAEMPDEPHAPARIVIVDPRRTVRSTPARSRPARTTSFTSRSIRAPTSRCSTRFSPTSPTRAGSTRTFIAASTNDFDKAVAANKTSIEDAAKITGLKPEDIIKAAEWIAMPKEGGKRRRTMFCLREGPDLGQRQLPHQRRAGEHRAGDRQYRPAGRRLRPHGRPSGRLCPPVRRSCRPARRLCRPAPDRRQGRRPPHLGLRPLQDHAQRDGVQARLQGAHRQGEGRHGERRLRRPARPWSSHRRRDQGRRAVRRRCRHHPDQDRAGVPCLAAGGDLGRDEPHLDERRAAHAAHRALHGPARASRCRTA